MSGFCLVVGSVCLYRRALGVRGVCALGVRVDRMHGVLIRSSRPVARFAKFRESV